MGSNEVTIRIRFVGRMTAQISRFKVLLKGQVTVYSYNYLKFARHQIEQRAVLDSSPTHLLNSEYGKVIQDVSE